MRPLSNNHVRFVLLEDFFFTDVKKRKWTAKKRGLVTDGASIPQTAWSLVGSPFTGAYRLPAVIHDQYCQDKHLAESDHVHEMFYNGMRAAGVGENKALIMWTAVYIFGPHWRKRKVEGHEIIEVFYYSPVSASPPYSIAGRAVREKDIGRIAKFIDEVSPKGSRPVDKDPWIARLKELFDMVE